MVCRWFFFWGVGCVDRISVSGGFQVDVQFYELTHTFFVVFSGLFHPSLSFIQSMLCYDAASCIMHLHLQFFTFISIYTFEFG